MQIAVRDPLTGFHGSWWRGEENDRGRTSDERKQLRIWGEFPGIALAIIVVLVIVKPF